MLGRPQRDQDEPATRRIDFERAKRRRDRSATVIADLLTVDLASLILCGAPRHFAITQLLVSCWHSNKLSAKLSFPQGRC